ncbi:MAG TPA: mannuronate-specific alginate lyase [Fontimonas sp.]
MKRLAHYLLPLPAAILVGLWSTLGSAATLQPPPGYAVAVGQGRKDLRECPTDAQPFTAKLDFPSKFEGSDKARDDRNPVAEAEYRRRIKSITAFERGVSKQVDDYMRAGKPQALDCAIGLLHSWSTAGGLQGESTTHTGKSMRKWALGSVAASYLRLKFSPTQPLSGVEPARIAAIESWMSRVADQVVAEWRDQPLKKTNNHEYWAAWAVMAVGVALDRRDLFDWSVGQYHIAARQIDAGGYLPNELARDTRALYYHNYALTPLAMIAAFGKANGLDLAAENDRALDRLVGRVLAGIDDPDDFEDKTGSEQVVSELGERSKFAWMEAYCWTTSCDKNLQKRLDKLRPISSTRLGGNVSDLFSVPAHASRASGASPSPLEISSWKSPSVRP